jgi:predicted amidohydrolase
MFAIVLIVNGTNHMRVAALQLQSQDEILANLTTCEYWISAAASEGAQFIVLPENFAYFGDERGRRGVAESLLGPAGPIREMLSRCATQHSVAILAGGWPEATGCSGLPYNSATVFVRDGGILANYRKIHRFDVTLPSGEVARESSAVSAGSEIVCCDLYGFRVGLSICYDLRFPELYRRLVERGSNVLCIPSAFTKETGKDHWHLLVRARAIESQCWVIAANQWGTHPAGRSTYGHSIVVDPWGNICAEAGPGTGMIVTDIHSASVAAIRASMPCLYHRRNL